MKLGDFRGLFLESLQESLTELVRACAYCDLIRPENNVGNRSHGYCREHLKAYLMQEMDYSNVKAETFIREQEAKGISFPPNTSGAKETDPLPYNNKKLT